MPRKYRKSKVKREPGSATEARDLVTMDDVRQEVDTLMDRNRIGSYKTKVVKKNFAFDKPRRCGADEEVPYETEYLQVEFQPEKHSTHAQLETAEGECFSAIFNVNASHLEQIIIDLKLKGKHLHVNL